MNSGLIEMLPINNLLTNHIFHICINRIWCLWCNGYHHRKWTRQHEFKSWTRLIAFHIALIPFGKV